MGCTKILSAAVGTLAVIAMHLTLATGAQGADTERVLHDFNFTNGNVPEAGVIFDAAGNLYGTTQNGGINCNGQGCGLIFKLTPGAKGKWTETVLHRFNGNDGFYPTSILILDAAGNLYGTTQGGGLYGGGTVFRLTLGANGKWSERVLHSFGGPDDGTTPFAGVTFDSAGNLYGTTHSGGIPSDCPAQQGCGVVFKLTPGTKGQWTETVLYRFKGDDGANSTAGVTFDAAGNLYGTTESGGDYRSCLYGCGTAFELTPRRKGKWAETVLHKFTAGSDGAFPFAALIFDPAGNLYGTAVEGGDANCYSGGCGVVFKLTRGGKGGWKETVLYSFSQISEGNGPVLLICDTSGNLYGATSFGDGYGNVYKLTPNATGGWSETVLFSFNGGSSGWSPTGLIVDTQGNLYGTTAAGGNPKSRGCQGDNGCGLVFELVP